MLIPPRKLFPESRTDLLPDHPSLGLPPVSCDAGRMTFAMGMQMRGYDVSLSIAGTCPGLLLQAT